MTEVLARVATTGIIKQGGFTIRITKEAIESVPAQIAGDQAVPITVDHDPFCMPIGKIEEAWVEPFGDEYAVMARIHLEDAYSIGTHRGSGIALVNLDFENNPKPFKQVTSGETEQQQLTLSVDLANFDSLQDYTRFADDVALIDDDIACGHDIGRHALIPEPFIQFVVANPELSAALAWTLLRAERFVSYTVDETLRKIGDDFSDLLSMKVKEVLRSYGSRRSKDNRPSITQIIVPSDMELILLTKTEVDEEFQTIDMTKLTAEMEKYRDLFQDADSATFARVGTNSWKFQYLKTRSGKVIGTLDCYKRTRETLRRMGRDQDTEAGDDPTRI